MRSIVKTSWVILVALMISGCVTEALREGHYAVRSTPQNAEDRDQFVNLSPELVGKISIDKHGVQRDDNGRLVVQIFVRNRTDFPQAVDAQVSFRNAEGFDIKDTTAWQRLTLEPNATVAHTVQSIDDRAAKYVVRFRSGF